MSKGIIAVFFVLASAPLLAQTEARYALPDHRPPLPGRTVELDGVVQLEDFDDITTLPGHDWSLQNLSEPLGITNWFQGNPLVLPAQTGVDSSYIAANLNNTTGGAGTISNWLITPIVEFNGVSELRFWTRVPIGSSQFPDRLEIRLNTTGSTDVGNNANSVGDFTHLLLTINPNLLNTAGNCPPDSGGYPEDWCEIVIDNNSGIPTQGFGRIAFHYFVDTAGPIAPNSNYIGIDTFSYSNVQSSSNGPRSVPSLQRPGLVILMLSLLALGGLRARRSAR